MGIELNDQIREYQLLIQSELATKSACEEAKVAIFDYIELFIIETAAIRHPVTVPRRGGAVVPGCLIVICP